MRLFDDNIKAVYEHTLSHVPWSPPGVSLTAARKMWPCTRGENVVVAVLDTGIDYQHSDLKHNIIGGQSFVAGESDFMDENGHGTHVSGTIAANGKILGVAPESKILALKVLNKNGNGRYQDIIRAINWCINWIGPAGEKVNIMNMSLGGSIADPYMHKAIKEAVKQGISVVCAAGNQGDGKAETDEISYPAYYHESIAVGAVNLNLRIANFSNSNKKIDLVGPGVATYSTYINNKYVELSGTSMATPHVSGAIALIYSRFLKRFNIYPSNDYIRTLISYQAIDLGELGFNNLYGFGFMSFNLDGGKTLQFTDGQKEYLINGEEQELNFKPICRDGYFQGSYKELSNLLSSDSETILPGVINNEATLFKIWA